MAMHSIRCGTGYRHCQLNLAWLRDRRAHAPNHAAPVPNTTIHVAGGQQVQLGHEHSGHGSAHDGMQPVGVGLGGQPAQRGRRPGGLRSSTR